MLTALAARQSFVLDILDLAVPVVHPVVVLVVLAARIGFFGLALQIVLEQSVDFDSFVDSAQLNYWYWLAMMFAHV